MGKKNKAKGPVSTSASEKSHFQRQLHALESLFTLEDIARTDLNGPKMASGASETPMEEAPENAMLGAIKVLETILIDRMTALLKPVHDQLSTINTVVAKTQKIADNAMELALTVSEGSRTMQMEQDTLKQRIMMIDMEARALNLKIRGLPEKVEGPLELQSYIANWMATLMHLENGIAPCLTKAHRLGSLSAPKRQRPWDILVTFLYMRDKIAFLRVVHKMHPLKFNDDVVEIFQDIPPEALEMQRVLKPITLQLQKASKQYKWSGPARFQIQHNGSTLTAHTTETGLRLLEIMGIPLPQEYTKKTPKRKLEDLMTPPKETKISATTKT